MAYTYNPADYPLPPPPPAPALPQRHPSQERQQHPPLTSHFSAPTHVPPASAPLPSPFYPPPPFQSPHSAPAAPLQKSYFPPPPHSQSQLHPYASPSPLSQIPTTPQYDQPAIPPAYGNAAYQAPLEVTEAVQAPPPAYTEMPMQVAPLDKGFAGMAPEKLQAETEQHYWMQDQAWGQIPQQTQQMPQMQQRWYQAQQQQPQMYQYQQQQQHYVQQGSMSFAEPPQNPTIYQPPPGKLPPPGKDGKQSGKIADDVTHGKMKRFVGDTLVGRFARASMTSASSTFKIAGSLSPWGDNNPVVLPNVRYRDAVSFVTVHAITGGLLDNVPDMLSSSLGADNFIAEVVTSSADFLQAGPAGFVVKIAILQLVEQAIDRGVLEHLLPDEEKVTTTTNLKSIECVIKNKLIDARADLRFINERPSSSPLECAKAWFCPYLMASSRIPAVPRATDFAIAQFFGPYLGADPALAMKLLAESIHVMSLCPGELNTPLAPGVGRLALIVLGISPYRGGRANAWSTSWRPGAGLIRFHIFNGCPAIVIPVSKDCPGLFWSPWTLKQMREGTGGYSAEKQHEELCEFLDGVVMREWLVPTVRVHWEPVLGKAVSLVVNGALGVGRAGEKVLGKMDDERAGIVGLRF
ncbi:MAG: hypothetical protein M1814_001044 [Vezdaea aestivalis]|nr:MAG: hypothetical protein M1814_001044 [Vezdaea aestivalis]